MKNNTGFYKGYEIYLNENEEDFRWCDTKNKVTDEIRPCKKCNLFDTPEGHDPCIANLPGIKFACCGHGIKGEDYILFDNDVRIVIDVSEISYGIREDKTLIKHSDKF